MFLGLDIGTTATKAALFDEDGRALAAASQGYVLDQPRLGIVEIDPERWIEAIRAAVAKLREAEPAALAATRAIGVSGQMHSIVCLGADDRAVRPALLWNDGRGTAEAAELEAQVPDIAEATGVVPMPSFSAAKLLWLRRGEPEAFASMRRIAWAKDVVRHWLTGEWVTEVSDAAGGQLLDEAARNWFVPVLDYLQLKPDMLPRLMEGPEAAGRLRAEIAAELGLPAGIPVAAGGADAATGALGLGCLGEGDSFLSLGTGAILVSVQERYRPEPASFLHTFAHCLPGRWYQMAAMLNGATCLAWAARLCNQPSIEALLGRVEALGPQPGRVLFQPYLFGERTPHNDVGARGAFVGLEAVTDAADLAKAVMEGVALSLRQSRDLMRGAGSSVDNIRIIGGGARSNAWCQMIATILDQPLTRLPAADYIGAWGAAQLAALCLNTGMPPLTARPATAEIFEPDSRLGPVYEERFGTYIQLYPALRSIPTVRPAGTDRN